MSIRKLPLDNAEEYDQYQSEQESGRPQYAQLPVQAENSRVAAQVYLGYRRCREFDEGNQPGQDYAVVRIGRGYVIGVVADGVSRSFYGNMAAKHISTWLVDELWQCRAATPDEELMERLLKDAEAEFADIIKEYRIPTNLPPHLVQVLERKRTKGSQTVFAAFVLDVYKAQLALYQVGDIKALIHTSNTDPELVESPAKGRWSSAGNSPLLLKKTDFEDVSGLVIKSDGVSKEWGHTLDVTTLDETQFRLMEKTRSPDDDISFIAVRYCNTPGSTALTKSAAIAMPVEGTGCIAPAQPVQRLPQQEVSGLISASSAKAVPSDQNAKNSRTHDVQGIVDKRENEGRKGQQLKEDTHAAARGRQRSIIIFVAGVFTGAVFTLLALFAAGRLKSGASGGIQAKQEPTNQQSNSDKRTSNAPDSSNISVEAKAVEQRGFQNKHASSFPPLIKDNPTTLPNEIIAYVSVEGVSNGGVEIALNEKERAVADRAREDNDRSSFFVRLKGLAGPTLITIRLIDQNRRVIYETQKEMRGREKKTPTNKDPFLGYYEIYIRRAG